MAVKWVGSHAKEAQTPANVLARLKKLWEQIDEETIGDTVQENQAHKGAKTRGRKNAAHHKRSKSKRKTVLILPVS